MTDFEGADGAHIGQGVSSVVPFRTGQLIFDFPRLQPPDDPFTGHEPTSCYVHFGPQDGGAMSRIDLVEFVEDGPLRLYGADLLQSAP